MYMCVYHILLYSSIYNLRILFFYFICYSLVFGKRSTLLLALFILPTTQHVADGYTPYILTIKYRHLISKLVPTLRSSINHKSDKGMYIISLDVRI